MVTVNGSMVGPLGQSPGGGKVDLRGPGTGSLKVLGRKDEQDGPHCKDEVATGHRSCEIEFEASLSRDAGSMFLVHVVEQYRNVGDRCGKDPWDPKGLGRLCKCRPKVQTLVEFMSAEKYKKGTEVYMLPYTGCGCMRTGKGRIYLISSKSPLFEKIKKAATSNIITVSNKGWRYVRWQDARRLGLEPYVIVTGEWEASLLGPDELTSLTKNLESAAMDTLDHHCIATWSCCKGKAETDEQGRDSQSDRPPVERPPLPMEELDSDVPNEQMPIVRRGWNDWRSGEPPSVGW